MIICTVRYWDGIGYYLSAMSAYTYDCDGCYLGITHSGIVVLLVPA